MNMGTQQNQPTVVVVSVPYGWQRKFHRLDNFGENEADHPIVTKVYYVSPSGHILDTEKELNTYLKQSSLCRCYFNYERHSFDFDPNHRQSIQMEKVESDSSFCIDWASLFQSEFIYSQMVLCHNYLQEQSVDNFLERFRILHRNHNTGIESCNNDNDENEDDLSALSDDALTTNPRFIEWLQSFDHFSVIVLRDGHKMDLDFNLEQLVHLTYELKVAKKLPEDADKLFDDIREMNAMLKHNDPQFRESLNDNLLKQCDCSKSLEAVQHSQSNSSAILDKSSSSSSSSSSMLTTTIEPVVPDFLKLIKSDGSELSSPSCSDSESELDFDDLFGTKSSIIHNHQQQQQRQSQNNSQSHYMTSSELFALLKPKFLPQSQQQQQQFTEIKLIPAKSIVNNRIINSNSGNFLSPPSWNHHQQQQQFVIPNRQATNKLILTSNGSVGTLPPSIAAIQQQSQSNQATSQIPCNLFLNNTGIANSSSSSSTSSSSKTTKKNSANIVHYLPMDPINMANSMCLLTNPTNENHNKNTKKPPAVKKPRNQPRSTSPKTPPKKRNNKKQPVISSIPYNMFTETKQTPNLSMAQVSGSSGAQASSSTIPSGSIPLSSIAYNYQPNATKFSNLLQLPSTTTSSATSSATTTAAATASAIVPKFISTSLPVAPCSSVPPLLTSSIPLSLMSSSGPSSSLTSSPIKPGLQGHSSCASPVVKSSASLVSPSQSPSSLSSSANSVPSGSPIKLLFLVNSNGQLVPTMVPLSQTNNNTTSQQQQQQPLNNSPIQTSSLNSRSISTTVTTTTSAAIYQNSPSSTPSFSSAVPTIVSPSHANQQQPVQFQINLPMEFLQNSIKNGSPNRVINFNLPSSSSSHQSSPCSNTNGPSSVNDNNNSMTMNRVSLDTNSILAQMWAKRDLFKTVTTAAASSSFVSTSPQTTSVSGNVPIKPNYNLEVPASVIVNQQSNDHQPVVPIQHDDESKDESYKQFVNGSDSSSSQQNLVNWSNVSSGPSFEEEDPNQTLPTLIPSVDPESNTLQFNQEVQDNNNFTNLPVSNIDDGGDSVVINQQDKYENQNDYSEVNEDLNNQYFQDTQQQANEELEPERFIDPNEKSILVNNSIVQENQTNFHQQQTESFDYRLNLNDNNNEIFSLETDSVPVLTQFSSTDAAGTSMVISDTEQFIVQTNDETFEEENTPAEFHEDQVPENCSLENIEKQLKDEEDFDEESDDEEELQSLNYDEEDEESFDEEANYQDNLSFQEEEQEVEDDGQVVEDEDGENREFVLDNIDDQEAILSEPVTIISIENDELLPENLAELLVDDNQLFVISDENVPVVALEQDGEEEELVMDELISPAAAVINQSSSSIGTTASNERQSLDNPMQLLLQLTNGTGYELDDEDYRLKEKLSIKNERTNRRSLSTRIQETELSMVNHQVDNVNEKATEDEEPTFINQTEEDEDEDAENACDNGDFPVDNNNKELDDDDRQSLKMATTPQSEDNVSTSLPSLNDEEEDEEDGQNDCAEVVEQDEDFVEDDESFKNVDEVEEPSRIVDENENELSRIVDEDEDGPSRIVDEEEEEPSRIVDEEEEEPSRMVDEDEEEPSRIVDEDEEEPSRIVDEDEEEPSRIVDEDELSRTTHESLQQSGNEFENQDEDQSSEVNRQSTDDEQEEDDNDDDQDDFSHKDTNSPLFVNVDQEEDVPRQSEQSVGLYEDPENCERGTDSELLQLRSCPSPLISPPILSPTIFQQPADQLDPRNLFEDSGEELSISCPSLGNDDRDDNCPLISPPQMIFANFRNENLDPASLFEDTREENDVRRRDSQGSEDIEVGEEEGDDLPAIDDSDTQDDEEVDTPIVNLYEDRHLDSLESTNRSTTERIEQIRIAIGIDENCCNLTEADTSSAHLLSPPLPISFPNSPIKLPLTDQSIVTDSASGRHVDEPIIDHYRSPLISPSFRMLIPNDDEDEEEEEEQEQKDLISTSPETIVDEDEDELGEINLDGTYLRESQSNVSDRNLVDDESTTDDEDSQFTLTKNKKLKTSTDNSMTSNEVTNGQGGEEDDDEEDDDDDEMGTGGDNSADNSSTLDVLRSTERYFKRMKRLKLQLQFQGMPGVTESDDDMSVVRLSPPLPPQERIFDVGSIVWGQQGDVRFWPGKVVPDDEFKIMEDFDNKDSGKILVRWYGSHSYSLMSPENLITLSEGLEAHHHAQKRYRSGKRVNTSISQAIEEAMQDIDTIMD